MELKGAPEDLMETGQGKSQSKGIFLAALLSGQNPDAQVSMASTADSGPHYRQLLAKLASKAQFGFLLMSSHPHIP